MAGVTLGFLKYVLGFDSIQFRKGMTDAERDLVKLQKSFEKRGRQFTELGKGLTAFVTLPLAGIAAAGIKEAQETQQAMAQVNAALASMGPVAGQTAQQLKKAADALELKSTFEADEILRKVTANLLTFGNIGAASFQKAQQAAVDLATRLGTDLQSATILVGKALNDPVKGLTALNKAGIQFSASQKATIKAMVEGGNAAGAQAVILKELERQFKGSAAAAANADPLNQANKAWKQMAETIGQALLPILPAIRDAVVSIANAFAGLSPQTQRFIIIGAGLAAALGPLLIVLGSLTTVIASIGPAVVALSAAWTVLKVAFLAARVAALATLPALLPFLVPLGAIALAVGAVYLAWKNWDKITAFVSRVYTAVKTYMVDKLNAVWDWVKNKIDAVIGYFRNLWDQVVGHSYIPDMVVAIGAHMAKLDGLMVEPAKKATAATTAAFKTLKDDVTALLDQLYPEIAEAKRQMEQLALLRKGIAAGTHDEGMLVAAMSRVTGGNEVNVGGEALVVPTMDLQAWVDAMPQIVDRTQQWRDALSEIGMNLFQRIGDQLIGLLDGSTKLKDIWKDLLAFGLQALTSQGSPLYPLIWGGGRAAGGPVLSNRAYLVGEKGPEIFMPRSSGRIVSNDNSRRMMGGVTMNVYTPDADSFRRSDGQITRSLKRKLA